MKRIATIPLFLAFFLFMATAATAQSDNAVTLFKKHIHKMVQQVEQTEVPQQKRKILNNTFDELLTAFDRVKKMKKLSAKDQAALQKLAHNITSKKNEL